MMNHLFRGMEPMINPEPEKRAVWNGLNHHPNVKRSGIHGK